MLLWVIALPHEQEIVLAFLLLFPLPGEPTQSRKRRHERGSRPRTVRRAAKVVNALGQPPI
jgi:hypothetical protein